MFDIFLISRNKQLLESYRKKVFGIKLASSLQECYKKSFTKFFWVIFEDFTIHDCFDFSYQPDEWSQDVVHVFLNGNYFDGVCLIPKDNLPTKKELEYRFFTNKKEVDIQASKPNIYDRFYVTTYDDYIDAAETSETDFFWIIPNDISVNDDFDFSYQAAYWEKYPHVFRNGIYYDGVSLHHKNNLPTKKEFEHRFYATKKEVDIQASTPEPYDVFEIENYKDYEYALEQSSTEMFWMSSPNIKVNEELIDTFYFSHHNTEDRSQNHAFVHEVDGKKHYNGLFLCSKKQPLTRREVEYRFPVNRREWDLLGSTSVDYDKFEVNTYNEYKNALENTKTEMFWVIPTDIIIDQEFDFDLYFNVDNEYDRHINHVFLNGDTYDGVMLCSKHAPLSKREVEHRFLVNKKEHKIQASTPKPYDVFEIETYIEYEYALEQSSTEMFWMSSPNIKVNEELIDTFYFSHHNTEDRSQNHAFVHEVDGKKHYNGLFLCSKKQPLTKREVEYRFPVARREWDLVGSTSVDYDKFEVNSNDEYMHALENAKTELFWLIPKDVNINNDFDFDLYFNVDNEYDRHINHVFLNGEYYDGVMLCSKHAPLSKREVEHRFLVNKKDHAIQASTPKPYDVFEIENYKDYEYALENSSTEMFWMISPNIKVNQELIDTFYFSHHNTEDRSQNHAFVHEVNGEKHYNGLFLCSKKQPLTKREVEYRFPVNRREWDVVGSTSVTYDKFEVNTYDEYMHALENTNTEMFWAIPTDIIIDQEFDFGCYFNFDNEYDRHINHVFLNGEYYDGVMLCSKHAPLSKREIEYRFIVNKKEQNILASRPKLFDIVFVSYDEQNAEENFRSLVKRFPYAKRIHGVKGIHQAHIEAAKSVQTEMFWVVDGDAQIKDDFDFDYQVPRWERDTVHVCRSQNPVNGLIYGYGGVKLLPTNMTINMDTSKPDMTTSISNKFKPNKEISNITAFNTDPFSAWKSGFRECAKLASKTIDRQKDEETKKRLDTWCNVGVNAEYGVYAIKGAIQGRQFGEENKENPKVLAKINDFDWLKEQYNELAG